MSDIAGRIALLPPDKRALLAARLARSERPVHGLRQQVPTRERGVPAPLSYNQRSVWFLDQLYPGNVAYNSPIAVRLSGRLNPSALEWSWNQVVRRHDLLRTVFELRDGDPVQYAKPFRPVRLRRMELGHLPESQRTEAAREEAVREAQQPFDLASGPPWRSKLLCCSEREHMLVVVLHHIICDGWSIGILVRELVAGYEAFLRGETSPLPELPIQYADYAAWQREQLARPGFQRHVELWRKRLEGVTDVLQIPLDKPRPAEATFRGARLFAQLPPTLTESLRRVAQSEGATLFMVLLGAFKVLLSRYSGKSDVIVGSQIANRERSEFEGLIGFFANTQALRTNLSGDPTFLELLARVRDTALGAYDSQEVPFKKLVEELKPEKQPNRNPFFDIDFNFRNLPLPTVNVPDLNVDLLRIDNGTSKFDLSVEIAEIGSGLDVAVEYSTELFDASTPARLLKNYQTLLEGIIADPKRRISQLPLLTGAERHQILVEWNQTTTQHPSERCIHELFEEQVKRTPETVAVIFENQQLSYQELNGRANRLAHYLIKCGAKPESFVGVMVERSIDMIVAILATLKAGAAYLPLDSDCPQVRLTQILTDAMPTVVLSNARLRRRLPETFDVLELDAQETEIALGLASVENPTNSDRTDPLLSNPAYLIYTSGSTGTPKGVVIEHAALSVFSRTVATHYELSSRDRVMQFASLSFDAAVEEIFPTLIVGASLVMRGSEIWTNCECRQKIRELGITVVNLPTAYWEQLVHDWATEEDNLSTNVRLVLVGGEAMRPQGVGLWRRTPLRDARLLNTYGPTEATVVATTFEVPPTARFAARVPIGKPLPGRLAYVLDGNLEPVPVGVPGELYLGGKCLARGYLNQPKLSAERFVADSHSVDAEARMYRTGDWARWLPDGNIEFIGRSDNQVKIRGFRIEPGEVEVLLRHHAGVRDAVVVAREDEPGQSQLVAYILSRNGSAPTDLRSFLQGKLPSYMIPSAFVELDALPMTTSGKVDRKALPKPERQLQGYRAPRTPEEEILCGTYADLLSLERVGIDDSFFSLGGHSLLAMQLVSRVRSAFGVELALRAVFEAPAVAELIGRLPGARKVSVPLTRQERHDELHPLSYTQRSVWFLDQLYPGNVAYNLPIAVRLSGRLNPSALEWSLNQVVRRHDLLRTVFELRDGDPVQYAKPFRPVELRRMELGHLPESERMEASREEAVREAQQPFDLASGPPWRAKLLCCAEREHVLVVILNHIICDGWSIGILVRELVAGYEAFLRGETSPLPELPIQYADYAAWQREQLARPGFQRHVELWRKRLEGVTSAVQFPLDKPRPAEPTLRGARLFAQLPLTLTESLRRIAHSEGATLFMVLLGAFKVLLSRYSGQSDIIVGSPIANRERREFEGLIGFFANTLALRTDLSGDPTFVELLARVREVTLRAYDSQEVPFEKLVEELRPERKLNRNPFFDISLSLQNLPMPAVNVPDLSIELLRLDNGTSKFDLGVAMVETARGLTTTVEYSTDLFDASTAARLLNNYRTVLDGIVADPRQRISRLPLLTLQERGQILAEWNQTAIDYPSARSIHHLFEEQVERTPEAVAVLFGNEKLTYGELNIRANRLAHELRALGVGPDVLVGLCVERSVEMVIGVLGILKAGGAYVPLDPAYPKERLQIVLKDSQAVVLLTQERLRRDLGFESLNFPVICLDTSPERDADGPLENPHSGVRPDNLSYVIYTSGSTGTPKGVEIEHRALVNHMQWMCACYPVSRQDRVLSRTSISFDAAVWEFWLPLLSGAVLCLPPAGSERDPAVLINFMNRLDISIAQFVPTLLSATLDAAVSKPNKLRLVFSGGEILSRRLAEKVIRNWNVPIVNLFGPTETTIQVTHYVCTGKVPDTQTIPIGTPIWNTQIYILDRSMQPVPVGVEGEIHIGGCGLARGYHNRPELTAEKFIPDPFNPETGNRLYRTGDLARYLPDGNIEFLGRRDNQVKIRGFRIELGEIEAALRQSEGVGEAVVVAREDTPGDRRLVAYVVPTYSEPTRDWRGFLRGKLPDYMVPSAFVVLEKLPLTANGKVDRGALPAPLPERELEGYRAPRTPQEQILCGIYADLLKLERVGIDDNFFSLGGHSLLAMRLVSRVRSSLGAELSVRAVFEAPTVAELIARLPGARKASGPLARQERPEWLPLSFAQRGLWFLDRLGSSGAEYNMREALRLRGELDVSALERAIQALVERHEILHTRFDEHEGEPCQVIEPALRIPFRVEDLSGLEESQREEAIDSALRREGEERFDLGEGSLLRVKLLKLGAREHILFWICHHIVSDGWSIAVFHRDLRLAYEAFCEGAENPLQRLELQYADYALWQRSWMQGKELERVMGYWQGQLAGAETLELPTDRPRPPRPSYLGGRYGFMLGEELSARLAEFNRREHVTPFMSLLAAFQVLLYRYSGQADFMVGTPVANRAHVEAEELIGIFVNSLVMRADLRGEVCFRELVSRVRRAALDAYQHQDLPFEKLVEELNPERDMSRHPLFQVMFALQSAPREALELCGVEVTRQLLPSSSTRFDLELHLWQGDGWSGALVYSRDLFEEATIEGMARHFEILLEGMLREPERAVSLVPMMPEGEREGIVVEWNATRVEYPRDRCIHEVFEEQARRNGQAVAVVFGERELSYGELERQSTQLARYLRNLGVGVGARVAICLEPSVEMIVGFLGILKAGAAYVPVDPGYPKERISFMLAESEAAVVLTREGLLARFSGERVRSVCLDRDWERVEAGGGSCAVDSATAEDVAYVIFTSGSTGMPKGVCVPHRAVVRLVVNCDYVQLGEEEVMAQISNCCFDAAIFEIWGALLNGSRLVGIAREDVLSAESFCGELARHGVTTLFVTTALFNELAHERADIFRNVRQVLFGGEECDAGAVRKVMESGGRPQRLINLYGPTETTTFATWYEIKAGENWEGRIPIGRPIANTEVYIVDGHLNPVPIGMAGEICIGGEGVAEGYLNRPELTQERFIASPFVSGQRLYRTGDLGRFLGDGNIEFLGRRDGQVKIRGFRVELGEIECLLRQHPSVAAATVIVRQDSHGDKQLVAYMAGTDTPPEANELREFLGKRVPDYMMPAAFVVLDKLPLTANGKIDLKALPEPVLDHERAGYVAPRSETEKTVAEAWSAVLDVQGIGVHDDFFHLGGHSILATRVISQLRSVSGTDIPLHVFFENATVAAIAEYIEGARWTAVGRSLAPAALDREELVI